MRTKLPPASGRVTWLSPALNGNRQLEVETQTAIGIESHIYELVPCASGFDLLRVKDGDSICYHITVLAREVWTCDCPDATNRSERRCNCKHVRGLRAALRALPF